jgi:hypothetical protein
MAPSVVAGNFHLDYRKIPYNVPSIDFIFSHDIDPASVTSNSFKMYPFVKGAPIVKNGNTISYVLQEPLKIGTKYLIELAPDITTTNKVAFGKTASYEVEAIGGVGVTKMIPEGVTTGLSKNPLFIFNLPVVPLSTLESREKLPCPVVFEPAIKGRCTWPSGNILEYKLDAPLSAATKYTAKIVLGSEFLFPLDKPFESTFSTTPIWRLLSNNENGFYSFSSRKGLEVIFSAPVKASDLEKYLQLYSIQNTPSVPANPSATPEQQFKEFIDNQEKNATPKDRALEIQNALNNPVSGSARPMAPEPPSAPDTKDTKNTYAPNYGTTVKYSLLDSEGKKLAPDAVSTKFFISGETGPFDFNQEFTVFIAK